MVAEVVNAGKGAGAVIPNHIAQAIDAIGRRGDGARIIQLRKHRAAEFSTEEFIPVPSDIIRAGVGTKAAHDRPRPVDAPGIAGDRAGRLDDERVKQSWALNEAHGVEVAENVGHAAKVARNSPERINR